MARDPNNIHRFSDYAELVPNLVVIPDLDDYTQPDYDLNDEKEFAKYITDIEKTTRGSFEYQQMVRFCRENLNMSCCSFYESVSNADTTSIRIELHHEPLSLYDIVMTVFKKRVQFGESLEVEHVAKEVMYNHYAMCVGLIPLADTVHDLVHNQYLFIPNDKVFGMWRTFANQYHDYIAPETLQALEQIQAYTDAYNSAEDDAKNILAKHFIYVDADGSGYKLPRLEDVQRMMKDRVNELMNSQPETLIRPQITEPKKNLYCPFVMYEPGQTPPGLN